MKQSIAAKANLDQLKKQAKTLIKAFNSNDTEAAARLAATHPRLTGLDVTEVLKQKLALNDAQWVIAREHGFKDWTELKHEKLRAEYFEAAHRGDTALLRKQIKCWPDLIQKKMENGLSALHLSIVSGHADAVRFLLECGANPTNGYGYGQGTRSTTPLQLARDAEHAEVITVIED